MNMRRFAWIFWIALVLFTACSEPLAGLRVNPGEASVEPGGELVFTFTGAAGDDLVWTAHYGTVAVRDGEVIYRAPAYAVDDVVEAVRSGDPRERARALVRVRENGVLSPRIRVSGDLALVFTRPGEERSLDVVVYDASGQPDPDAAVTFSSDDPDRVAVKAAGGQRAIVRALSGDVGTVRLRVRYRNSEAYAWAVAARLQPGARRIEPSWIVAAEWEPDAFAWSALTLVRTPETEALVPGQVVFSGDRAGVWGRVRSLRLEEGRVVLDLEPATLSDIFRELDFRMKTPAYRVKLSSTGAGSLRLLGPGGEERLVPPRECAGLRSPLQESGELSVSAVAELKISGGRLRRARWGLEVTGETRSGAMEIDLPAMGEGPCDRVAWRVNLPPASWLLFPVQLRLTGRRGLSAGAGTAVLTLPPLRTRWHLERGWRDAGPIRSLAEAVPELRPDAGPRLHFAEPGESAVSAGGMLAVQARAQVPGRILEAGTGSSWRYELDLRAAAEGELDPAVADYRGPEWELAWKGAPEAGGRIEALLAAAAGFPLPPVQPAPEKSLVLGSSPRVWAHLDTGGMRRVDLGNSETGSAARFNFEAEPRSSGRVELWLRGGACEVAAECFEGSLERVASVAFPGGPLFWRPEKKDRGVYEVFLRYRLGAAGSELPYAARPPEPLLTVAGPDLQGLPLDVRLIGRPGGAAVGVLSYTNDALPAVAPDGRPVELTSTLRVWTPADGSLQALPRQLALAAGRTGYHRLSAVCPKTPGVYREELPVFTNDPEQPELVLPALLICDGTPVPAPALEAEEDVGPAPFEAHLRLGLRAPSADLTCSLDFGDGSPPVSWPAGSCPESATVKHVYARPGVYQAVLLVGDAAGDPLDLAFVFLRVD